MYSVSKWLLFGALATMTASAPAQTLRICSDPNNLPYSNDQRQGFENRIAEMIAGDLGEKIEYFWFPQREKFFAKTLRSHVCDVVMGVPANFDKAATTRPYYRSTYVFMTRRSSGLHIHSLDDSRLRRLKIGVQILGDEDDNLPPVNALISRGIVKNLVGFSIFGNLNEKDPPADVIRALEQGKVDVAIVWGPLGGYFARNSAVPLAITPIADDPVHPDIPLHFDIAIGVRRNDADLKKTLDGELERRRPDIEQILRAYGIPLLPDSPETAQVTNAEKPK
jgi:mxaJ protein